MDPEEAIESEIEPKLDETLGPPVARSVLTMATLAYVTAAGGKEQRYHALVDSICSDQRVVRKWGGPAAARQAREWKDLVALQPETVVLLTHRASSEEPPP